MDLMSYLVVFYLSISVVALAVLDFFYVTYSQSRKRFAFAWPLQALRTLSTMLVTILFLPFLGKYRVHKVNSLFFKCRNSHFHVGLH